MDYGKELDAVQRWIKSTAGLNSWRRNVAPPTLPRPVIVWESPYRGRDRHLTRYAYVQKVTYHGKLYVNSLDESLQLQETLAQDIENRCGLLEVLDDAKERVAWLKNVEITFTDTEGLDVPFTLSYEVTYGRTKPKDPPSALHVTQKVRVGLGQEKISNETGGNT